MSNSLKKVLLTILVFLPAAYAQTYAAAAEASLKYAEKFNANADTIITSQTATNPPFFNWKQMGPVVLEYSKDEDFKKGVEKVNTEYNFYTPQKFLTPGKWYWRICKNGKYDFTRCIVVPEKTHRFICPPIDKSFVLSKPRPRLVTAKQISKEDETKLRTELKNLDDWEIPSDPPAYDSKQWTDKWQWYSQVKRVQVIPAGKRLQRIAEIYGQLKDNETRNILEKWVNAILSWDPNGGSSPVGEDIAAYHILRGLNYSYDVLHDSLAPELKQKIRDMIIIRAKALERLLGNPFPIGQHKEYNNHAWLRTLVLGESGLVLLGDYERAYEWAEYAKELLTGKYLCGLGFQGENNEGLAYWAYGGQFLLEHCSLIKQAAGIDLFNHQWLKNTARFALYCAPKNSWAVSFADTGTPNHFFFAAKQAYEKVAKDNPYSWKERPVMSRVEYFTKELAKECGDPYAMWYSRRYNDPQTAPRPPVDIEPSVNYEHIGWAILNTNLVDGEDGVTFAMRSGPYWEGHQHADENNYVINAYGSKLAIDSGYYDYYGGRHFLEYSTKTKAHNAILVNGEGQAWRKIGADGKINGYFDSPTHGIVIGDASDKDIYAGKIDKWLRKAIFIKPGLVILNDEISAKEPSQYDWLLHTVASIETDSNDNSFCFTSGNAVMQGCFLMPEKPAMAVTFGYPVLPTGLDDAKIKPEDVVDEWTLKVQPTEKKKDERFVSVMQIDRVGNQRSKPRIISLKNDDVIAFKVIAGSDRHLIWFNSTGKNFNLEDADTDAEIVVLSFAQNGQLQKYMVYKGSFLKFKNKLLFETDVKVNISCKNYSGTNSIFDFESGIDSKVKFYPAVGDRICVDGSYGRSGKNGYSAFLAAGRHIIGIGSNPAEYLAGKIEELDFNGSRLEGYKTRSENQRNYYWWGRFNCDSSQNYILQLSNSGNTRIYIDDENVDIAGLKPVRLVQGVHFIQISSSCEIKGIKLVKQY